MTTGACIVVIGLILPWIPIILTNIDGLEHPCEINIFDNPQFVNSHIKLRDHYKWKYKKCVDDVCTSNYNIDDFTTNYNASLTNVKEILDGYTCYRHYNFLLEVEVWPHNNVYKNSEVVAFFMDIIICLLIALIFEIRRLQQEKNHKE